MSENVGLYRRLNVPFTDATAANTAIEKFRKEVSALREKYAIPDVYTILAVTYISDDGEEARAITLQSLGDAMYSESMVAFALGQEQANRRQYINKLIAGAMREKVVAMPLVSTEAD